MDEIDFLRGVEGESQNEQDLVMGAEHFMRLKRQVGLTRPIDTSLELEKEAGELVESLATPETCKGCGKVKTACLCKTATIQDVLRDARVKTAGRIESAKSAIKTNPTLRAAVIGGATTGGVNAAIGAAKSPDDPIGGAVRGGVSGAAVGAGGGALYHHLSTKLAQMREKTASSLLERFKDVNPGLITVTGLGALAGGIGTYLSSRPQKDSGKGKAEEELEGQVAAQKNRPERGLLSKMHHRNTELEHGYAKAFREHPIGAAAIGTATGAFGGYGIGRLAGAAAKMSGGK